MRVLLGTVVGALMVLGMGCDDDSGPPPAPPGGGKQASPSAVPPGDAAPAGTPPTAEDKGPEKTPVAPKKAEKPPVPENEPPKRPVTTPPTLAATCKVPAPLNVIQHHDPYWSTRAGRVKVEIVEPAPNKVLRRGTLRVQVRLIGFRTFKSEKGGGNHLRVVLDNEHARSWYDADERPLEIDGLTAGLHTLRVFAATGFGEVIKGPGAFDAVSFYVRTTKEQPVPIDFSKPFITYSTPEGTYSGGSADRVMLDFHLANATLGPAGHRVRYTLQKRKPGKTDDKNGKDGKDGKGGKGGRETAKTPPGPSESVPVGNPVDLVGWSPVLFSSLEAGTYDIALELLDAAGKPAPGPFNRVERSFTVTR